MPDESGPIFLLLFISAVFTDQVRGFVARFQRTQNSKHCSSALHHGYAVDVCCANLMTVVTG